MADTTHAIEPKTRNRNLAITRKAIVVSGATLYQGQLVAIGASGTAANQTTLLKVGGIALQTKEAGEEIQLQYNHVVRFALSGAAATAVGAIAFAADNQTATLTPGTNNQLGKVVDFGTDWIEVHLNMVLS